MTFFFPKTPICFPTCSFRPFISLLKMKLITPTSITRIFLAGYMICFAFPITAHDGVIKVSRKQRWICIIMQTISKAYITYFYGFCRLPEKIRSDPYSFLAYLKGFFMSMTGILIVLSILLKSSDLAKTLQKLHDLQKELPFGFKRINFMFYVCMTELVIVYSFVALIAYYMYNIRINNFTSRIIITITATFMMLPTIATGFLYINCINILIIYFDAIHDKLKHSAEWKNLPQIW